ncbi:calcium-binding protein [Roseomonas chloroacetimidivorans]|uniref:calcium-binding protein n=1 Tax=Roseomonas chloroacetimidivorans TaxID=1766656 RepID=UPI003C709147
MSSDRHSSGQDGLAVGGLQIFATEFTALNNSGVDGQALLFLDARSQTLTVHIKAEGLEPNQVHPQHIHGFDNDMEARTPTLAQDDDRDGFVELLEGLDTYGPVQLNLTLNPDNSVHDHGTDGHDHTAAAVFPTADENGVLRYTETFRFDSSDENAQAIFGGITPLQAKEIVLHGLTLQEGQGAGGGEADGVQGYKAVLPIASGELQQVGAHFFSSQIFGFLHDGSADDADLTPTLAATGFADHLTGTDGGDIIDAEGGADIVEAGGGNDRVIGGTGDDQIDGGLGDDRAAGGNGRDTLLGGAGDDTLLGDAGKDMLHGGDGDDILIGGAAMDVLTGGAGRDHFTLTTLEDSKRGSGHDVITDFGDGDMIDLAALGAMLNLNGGQTFAFLGAGEFTGATGELHAVQSGGNTLVEGDLNGDGDADFQIELTGEHNLSVRDFIL